MRYPSYGFTVTCVVGLTAAASSAQTPKFDAQVARFVAQDALDPVPQNGIVFTGSSSIRRWEALTRDFADYHVIQRGIGGAKFEDIIAYTDDIIVPYNPRAVVVWAGTNDIALGGDDGEAVFNDYKRFVEKVHASLPAAKIYFLGISPTPGRRANRPQEDIANQRIAGFAETDERLHYIDLPRAFSTLNPYDDEVFNSMYVDKIHLNRIGYGFWRSVIRPAIEADLAPDKKQAAADTTTLAAGESFLFDFGPSDGDDGAVTKGPDHHGNVWNNWHDGSAGNVGILPGEHRGRLVSTKGDETGIGLTITGQFKASGLRKGGLRHPQATLLGDLAVGSATGDFFFSTADDKRGGGNDDTNGGFMLNGLDPNLAYTFAFFGSCNATQTQITEYRMIGKGEHVVTLQISGNNIGSDGASDANDNELARVVNVQPDPFGQVFVDLTLSQGDFACVNAMQVTATDPK